MSSDHRKKHGQNQSHSGEWITDENGLQWFVCSTQQQETTKNKKQKLTLQVPEEGCGGDDPQEGFMMKGLGTPQAPRHSVIEQHVYHDSSQLPTYCDVYTETAWDKHIEMICDCVKNGSLQQEDLNEEEFKAAYKFATGR